MSSEPIYKLSPSEIFTQLRTTPEGLSDLESARRLQQYGLNEFTRTRGTPLLVKFLSNFIHLMAILLWIGGVVALLAQLPQLAIAIWMVNLINGLFSFWQEYRAEKATEALLRILPFFVRVSRQGQERKIPAQELVRGDVILLEEGDRISADARLVEASELHIDQSTLTGESTPVRKISEAFLRTDVTPSEIPNLVFAGTSVAMGTGKAIVYATGMQTEFGKIAHLTQSTKEEKSTLQQEMAFVTRIVSLIAVSTGVVFFALSILLADMDLAEGFIFALGMIVAFVPEGLLPTVTLALAMGVQRLSRKNALVKKLSSVETLGCTTVICTDKTGTLTQNAMTVTDIWLDGQRLKVTGGGYKPEGQILGEGFLQEDLQQFLIAAGLCNNARLLPPDDTIDHWDILGDPTEAALITVARKGSIDLEKVASKQIRIRELPFDSRRKRMSTVHRIAGQTYTAYVKGAPREILNLCTHIVQQGKVVAMIDAHRQEILTINDEYARNGLRVLAIAMRHLPVISAKEGISQFTVEYVETQLTFLGLVAMMDPPRPEVAKAVEKCHQAGIRVIMITGDYGLTAESIARRVGIVQVDPVQVISGFELESLTDEQLKEALQKDILFARVAPEHKLRVVTVLQEMGHVVAVTGDGVNDAPALKKANIGVAMGITGTDVAKEAADLILTDDNFASIVNAVEEGRGVYANIRKFTTYIFTSNTPEAVPFILFAFSGARIPLALNVMHILSIDLGTDMIPALGLGTEPPERGVMDHPPRRLNEHVITATMLARAYLWLGPLQSLATMSAFYFMYWTNGYYGQWLHLPDMGFPYESATAMALAAVVTTQIGNVFVQRTEHISIFRINWFSNRLIWIGIATELCLIFLIVYAPFMHNIVGTDSFPLEYWLFLLAWIPALPLADEVRKILVRRRKKENLS